jgi:hypothetical protein
MAVRIRDALNQQEAARAMLAALKDLREWNATTGGWESPCWDAMRTAIDQAEAAGIKAEQ